MTDDQLRRTIIAWEMLTKQSDRRWFHIHAGTLSMALEGLRELEERRQQCQ